MSQHDPAGGSTAYDTPRNTKAQAKAEKAYRKANRPWYKKKRFWLLGIILLIIVIAVATSGGDEDPGASTDAATSAANEEGGSEAADAPAEEAAPAFPGAEDSDVVGQAGDELALGDVTVTSAPLEEGDATLGATLCTAVSVANGSDDTIDFNALDWKLQAPSGTILNTGFAGSDNMISAGQIAPGGTTSGDVCFDAEEAESGQYVVLYEPVFSFFSDRAAWINER